MNNYIFDFDGTLADSLMVAVNIFNDWSRRPETIITPERLEHLRHLTTRQIIKESHIPMWRIPSLLRKGRKMIAGHMDEVKPFSGIDVVLAELAKQHRLFILTSNDEQNVRQFLDKHHLTDYFEKIISDPNIFGKAKKLRKMIKAEGLNVAETCYIGDETRDIVSANQAGVVSVAVGWGYNAPAILERQHPDYLLHKPAELLKITQRS